MQKFTVISNNPDLLGMVSYEHDVSYRGADGAEHKMQLLLPMQTGADRRFPLILFIQGSAWTKPNTYWEIPQLARFAKKGIVVASVTHRSCFEAPAPAFLKDVKCALRTLLAKADEYRIDKDRVCAWGTSSGGNTALLLGLTGGMTEFEEGEHLEESSAVRCVVDCFGPTDLPLLIAPFTNSGENVEGENLMTALAGGKLPEAMANLEAISPTRYVSDKPLPPFLILQGDADDVVPYEQSELLYNMLSEKGHEAYMVRVTNAPHEGSFWSDTLLSQVEQFIDEKLMG